MLSTVEKELLGEIGIDFPWALIETFSTITREHPDNCNNAADIIAQRLAGQGVPVTMLEPTLLLSLPGETSVHIDGTRYRAKAPAMSKAAPDGIDADLLYVRSLPGSLFTYSRDPAVLFGEDFVAQGGVERIAGRILITEGYSNPAKISLFEDWGAAGVIIVNPGEDIHWGSCSTIWGTPDLDSLPRKPKISVGIVNNPDGKKIIAAAEAGKSGRLVTNLEEDWFKSKLPMVEIMGSEQPEKFVLLHGHYDSWDVGVGDNATGDAVMLEIARVLWRHRDKLKRSVRIVWWPGHSSGRYGGSAWFADKFAIDLDENCIAHTNCDSPGCRWATTYRDIALMPETETFAKQVIRDVTGLEATTKLPNRSSDYTFNNIGISGFFMATSMMPEALVAEKNYYYCGGCGGNIAWHTENDTMEIADKQVMITDSKIYLLSVLRLANADLSPFDWRALSKRICATIDERQSAAGDRFDLSPALEAARVLDDRLTAFYEQASTDALTDSGANAVIADLARILIPIVFTNQPRFTHDPAMVVPLLPAIADATKLDDFDNNTLGYAQTQLMRGQNRVVAALRQAVRRIETVLTHAST